MNAELNFNQTTNPFKSHEISMHQSKVVALSEALLEDPNNIFCQALLNRTIQRLELLLTA